MENLRARTQTKDKYTQTEKHSANLKIQKGKKTPREKRLKSKFLLERFHLVFDFFSQINDILAIELKEGGIDA